MFTVQISVFSLLKREIRLSEANATKGKRQDSSREGGDKGVMQRRRTKDEEGGAWKVGRYLVKSLGGEAGGPKCRHAESESSLLMG